MTPAVNTRPSTMNRHRAWQPILVRARYLIFSLGAMCAAAACAQTKSEHDADLPARMPQPAPLEISEPPPTPRPPLNANPQHGIEVSGRLPAHMEAGLRLTYATTSRSAACVDMVSFLGKTVGGEEKRFKEEVDVRHIGNRMETTVFLDKYGPGECRWRLAYASLWVRKPTAEGPVRLYTGVLDGSRYDTPDSEPMCDVPKRPDGTGCDEARLRRLVNADESIPVIGLCRVIPPGSDKGARPGLECRDKFDNHTKMEQLIKPDTRTATIDIYDLDEEPRPVGHGIKESE